MHLTNYLVENEINFDLDNGKPHSLKSLLKYLKVEKQNEIKLWNEIEVKQNIPEEKTNEQIFFLEYCIKNNFSCCTTFIIIISNMSSGNIIN